MSRSEFMLECELIYHSVEDNLFAIHKYVDGVKVSNRGNCIALANGYANLSNDDISWHQYLLDVSKLLGLARFNSYLRKKWNKKGYNPYMDKARYIYVIQLQQYLTIKYDNPNAYTLLNKVVADLI